VKAGGVLRFAKKLYRRGRKGALRFAKESIFTTESTEDTEKRNAA